MGLDLAMPANEYRFDAWRMPGVEYTCVFADRVTTYSNHALTHAACGRPLYHTDIRHNPEPV